MGVGVGGVIVGVCMGNFHCPGQFVWKQLLLQQ